MCMLINSPHPAQHSTHQHTRFQPTSLSVIPAMHRPSPMHIPRDISSWRPSLAHISYCSTNRISAKHYNNPVMPTAAQTLCKTSSHSVKLKGFLPLDISSVTSTNAHSLFIAYLYSHAQHKDVSFNDVPHI